MSNQDVIQRSESLPCLLPRVLPLTRPYLAFPLHRSALASSLLLMFLFEEFYYSSLFAVKQFQAAVTIMERNDTIYLNVVSVLK